MEGFVMCSIFLVAIISFSPLCMSAALPPTAPGNVVVTGAPLKTILQIAISKWQQEKCEALPKKVELDHQNQGQGKAKTPTDDVTNLASSDDDYKWLQYCNISASNSPNNISVRQLSLCQELINVLSTSMNICQNQNVTAREKMTEYLDAKTRFLVLDDKTDVCTHFQKLVMVGVTNPAALQRLTDFAPKHEVLNSLMIPFECGTYCKDEAANACKFIYILTAVSIGLPLSEGGNSTGTGNGATGTGVTGVNSAGTGSSPNGTGGSSTGTGSDATGGTGGSSTGTGSDATGTGGNSTGTGGSDTTGTKGSSSGTGHSATGTKGSSTGTGSDATGTGGNSTGTGNGAAGTGNGATGTGGSSTGTGSDATGTGGSSIGTGSDATGTGGNSIGTGNSATGTGGSSTETGGTVAPISLQNANLTSATKTVNQNPGSSVSKDDAPGDKKVNTTAPEPAVKPTTAKPRTDAGAVGEGETKKLTTAHPVQVKLTTKSSVENMKPGEEKKTTTAAKTEMTTPKSTQFLDFFPKKDASSEYGDFDPDEENESFYKDDFQQQLASDVDRLGGAGFLDSPEKSERDPFAREPIQPIYEEDKKTEQKAIVVPESSLETHDSKTPLKEDVESSHFMAYFLTIVVVCIVGYVLFHNKQKILAFILEGRGNQRRRQAAGNVEYRKLSSNVDEVLPAADKKVTTQNYIY